MSGLTNASVAQQVQALLHTQKRQTDYLTAWLGGSPTGGPNNDGRYPFVDLAGVEILVPAPATFNNMTSGPAALSVAAKVAAEVARDLAQSHADRANDQRVLAEAARGAAIDARNLAQEHRSHAATHEARAEYWANLAQGSGQSSSEDREIVEQLAAETADNAALAAQDADDAAASAALAHTFEPALYQLKSEMIDPAMIPILPSQKQFVSTGGLADLTPAQQAEIGQGSIVTTTDGSRWICSDDDGVKTSEASYIQLADLTPEISNVMGLSTALSGKANLASANTFTAAQTFTQDVTMNGHLVLRGGDPYIRRDVNSSSLIIAGGTGWTGNGPIIGLFGKDHANGGDVWINGVDGGQSSDLSFSQFKSISFNVRPTFNGAMPWDTTNLTPADKNVLNEYRARQVIADPGGRQLTLKTDPNGGAAYGVIHHLDATHYYLLLTNQNDANGMFNGHRPFRMNMANGDMEFAHTTSFNAAFYANGETNLPSYTRIWDRANSGFTVLEYRRQVAGAQYIGSHVFVSGPDDNPSYTMSVFKNGDTNQRSDFAFDYNGSMNWRGQPVWNGHNFNPADKINWSDANMDGGAYTVVRRNGDGGGFFTGRLHAYSQTATADVWNGGMEIQEVGNVQGTQSGHEWAPSLTFHWKNRVARALYMDSSGELAYGVQGNKANLAWMRFNGVRTDGNEFHVAKGGNTKFKVHENGIASMGNIDVENGSIFVRGVQPTIYMQDSDNRSGMIHVNSNRMYFLRGSGTNSTAWESINGSWPFELNLENNDAYFGGQVYSGQNGWFRIRQDANGIQAGIFWEAWGGGWFMQDADWMRCYNNKNIYTAGQMRANTVVGESDRRLKANIATITNATQKVEALTGVTFDWKRTGSAGMGFIAQDFEQVIPALVTEDTDGMKGVEYGPVVALLVEALKETNARVAALESGRV